MYAEKHKRTKLFVAALAVITAMFAVVCMIPAEENDATDPTLTTVILEYDAGASDYATFEYRVGTSGSYTSIESNTDISVESGSKVYFQATNVSSGYTISWYLEEESSNYETRSGVGPHNVTIGHSDIMIQLQATGSGNGTHNYATLDLQPGEKWSWTPTFTSGLSPTVTLSASNSSMPSDSATYSSTSGYASISNGTIRVDIPSNYSGSHYYVKVKAQTSQPTQINYYELTFNVKTYSLSYSNSPTYANVGSAITSLSPTVGNATAASYAISGTLPTGLSFNTSTGVISGTPSAYKAQANYTITATLNTTPAHTASTTVSIGAYTNITASNQTVYAIKGQTAISVPGVSMPTGTSLSSMSLSAVKDGNSVSVTAGTAYNGMTVAANTGAITGTPNMAGTYVFTETYTATAATGGSSATRTVTVVVEDLVAISGDSSFNSYVGHSDSITLTKSTGPSGVAWSITEIKKNGTAITSGTDFTSFSISNGTLTSGTGTTAGTYTVTVKLASTNTTANSNGVTGTTPATNAVTKDITVNVAAPIQITNNKPIYFYESENLIYDALTLGSNIAGATFSFTAYGNGINSSNITITSAGVISPGSSSLTAGNYTVTVQAVDPNNQTNTTTETVNVIVVKALAFTNTPSMGFLVD